MSQRPPYKPLIINPTGIQRFRMINKKGASGIRITSIKTIKPPEKQFIRLPDKQVANLPDKRIVNVPDNNIVRLQDKRVVNVIDNQIVRLPDKRVINVIDNQIIKLPDKRVVNVTDNKIVRLTDNRIVNVTDNKIIKLADKQIVNVIDKQIVKLPETKTKEQEDEELRIQVQKEIEQRARLCEHSNYECNLPCFQTYNYCVRHILDDPLAPYQPCSHIYGSGEKCPLPAPVPTLGDNRKDVGLCFEHAREVLHSRQRSAAAPPHVTTTETLLAQLQHYVNPERTRTTSCASSVSIVSDPAEIEVPGVPTAVDPFKQIDAIAINKSATRSVMDCASESESDADIITLGRGGNCRGGEEENELEPEYVNLGQPLGSCGVYTAEEAVNEAKGTLKILHEAYQRQMGRLKYLLHDARADYLRDLKTEKEQYCSINTQARSGPLTVKERKQLRKLKAFASYHKKHGVDAILYRKFLKKRAKANEFQSSRSAIIHNRCTFVEESLRCSEHSIPAAKHCMKHILHDRQQVLFVPCGDHRGPTGLPCAEPIAKLPMHSISCRYHTDPPPYTMFTLKKDDSESDQDSDCTEMEEPQQIEIPQNPDDNSDLIIEELSMEYPIEDDVALILPEDLDLDLNKPNT